MRDDAYQRIIETRKFFHSKGFTTTGSSFIFVNESELHLLKEEDVLHIFMLGANPVIIRDDNDAIYFKKYYIEIYEKYRLVLE